MKASKRVNIVSVQLVRESSVLYSNRKIESPNEGVELVRKYLENFDREKLIVVGLDNRNQPTFIDTISIGTINSSLVHPREVFKSAILSNSASIIMFHNHPSGETEASKEDINITYRIKEVGKIIGINLIDHIIIGSNGRFFKFKRERCDLVMININANESLNKIFQKELFKLINKFNTMSDEDKELLETLYNKLGDNEWFDDLEEALSIAKEIKTLDITEDELKLYLYINRSLNYAITMNEARRYYEELMEYDYILIKDEYLIYRKNGNLDEFVKDKLSEMLEDEEQVDRLLSKEDLIEYFINESSKREIISELASNLDIEEIFDICEETTLELDGIRYSGVTIGSF